MVDTVRIEVDIMEDLPQGKDYITRLLKVIDDQKERTDKHRGITTPKIIGKHYNFIIAITNNRFISIQGSLTKYLKGNNFDCLTADEIKQALRLLSKHFGFNVECGTLKRIDIADNLYLSEKPKRYVDSLLRVRNVNPWVNRNTKYFELSQVTIAVYDKLKELEKNDPTLHHIIKRDSPNQNVLRFEVRLLKQLNKLFKVKKVKAVLLYSPSFLCQLARQWYQKYESITKATEELSLNVTSLPQLKRALIYHGVKAHGGINAVINLIDVLKEEGNWVGSTPARAKSALKEIMNDGLLVKKLSLIEELDEAVANSNIITIFT